MLKLSLYGLWLSLAGLFWIEQCPAEPPSELRIGRAGHAFDHLGNIGEQAETAAACGANIIYTSGFSGLAYEGLPSSSGIQKAHDSITAYIKRAKAQGIQLAIGYVCATSIVRLKSFDRNWSDDFRKMFSTSPSQWLQVDRHGATLPSWYQGEYSPACMNNPNWRTYERYVVRLQLEAGHDGIFFDNPTVHPEGCYCEYCMERFAHFLKDEGVSLSAPNVGKVAYLRQLAAERPKDFLRFRSTIARDFLADMRAYARTVKPHAYVTCNNSLNRPDVFYSQSRRYGYNIHELSKVEDWVTVEDMVTQPRVLPDGKVLEYGPTYRLLHAIVHGKPIVACTIAESDYHTPPNLVRLAMAEAAAHQASYLSWPTWPEPQRARMIAAISPEAKFLRDNESLLNETKARRDAVLFLPYGRWLETDRCPTTKLSETLTRENIQFEALCEDRFTVGELMAGQKVTPTLIIESRATLNSKENATLQHFIQAGGHVVYGDQTRDFSAKLRSLKDLAVTLVAPPTVRAIVRDQPGKTLVHLLNLNIKRVTSFEDSVQPAQNIKVSCKVPFKSIKCVTIFSADPSVRTGTTHFETKNMGNDTSIEVLVPRLEIAAIILIEEAVK